MCNGSIPKERRTGFGSLLHFDLRTLFLLVNLSAVYFFLVNCAGEFVATLLVGPLVLMVSVVILRVENMVYGLLFGGMFAVVMVIIAAGAFAPVPPGQVVFASLVYPPASSALGLICVAHRQVWRGM
ncbi:hypothetical protein [Crateriforma conspicua]|uniref:Uncharacterized protein n=1 Tax=Crateriforma conspicua TaxID=2527996 RepID=A0A5C5YCU6_9PLAN|nr:hypothetical protein [Crateriforma conspicua]QDV61156.1 hypothetical protein Mal65_02790 [Crateriforma conspicua]TWT72593.1 hypothetical protein Pan14r_49130 [Crateriforma conspicua]